ncbi:MAG: Dihem cytochrome c [Alphaproteobacteria bacterium ADurb.Bin100]|jgi:nitrate/TMAO reductase-like tetraheme cytochrome c subunit|nr:MAG: Dihem cytochrome c [Alphaproteobacteria bacterium ADurb.Bin100]
MAWADGVPVPRQALPSYAQECGSCHMAFAPALLPAPSWQRIMNGLGRHYGTDASLDAASAQKIGAWLQANAGTYKRVREEPPQDRMTQSNWFLRKHREVAPDVFRRASIKSAANCTACHGGADQGNFSEHAVRIPK